MEEIKYYRVTLDSDQGTHEIWTAAINEWSAKQLICASQSCPAAAIISIEEKTKEEFKRRND